MELERMNKQYRLTGADGKTYLSDVPGTFGGNKSTHIYGKLGCSIALAHIAKGGYVKNRVFFANEQDAIAAGYRACVGLLRVEADREEAQGKIRVFASRAIPVVHGRNLHHWTGGFPARGRTVCYSHP